MTTPEPSKLWLRIEDIARELDVSITTARAWVKQMKHIRQGRVVRVHRATLDKWKAEHTCGDDLNSGDAPVQTGPSAKRTGRTSAASGSPASPSARTGSGPRARPSTPPGGGRQRENWNEPIHVAQPRKPRPSQTP